MIDEWLPPIIWECPLCGSKIPMPVSTRYRTPNEVKVDEHKKLHQRFGMVVA